MYYVFMWKNVEREQKVILVRLGQEFRYKKKTETFCENVRHSVL